MQVDSGIKLPSVSTSMQILVFSVYMSLICCREIKWYCLLIVVLGFRQHRAAVNFSSCLLLPSVLWCCWLGGRKGIRPVKNRVVGCWCGCLEQGADRFYLSGTGSLNKGPFNRCVCVFRTFLVSECILDCGLYFKVLFWKVHKLCSYVVCELLFCGSQCTLTRCLLWTFCVTVKVMCILQFWISSFCQFRSRFFLTSGVYVICCMVR